LNAPDLQPAGATGSPLPRFLITIDTEGDNLWAKPREVTTRNSRFLPRFQELCEAHGLKPTYLVNHEMARCPVFVELARDARARGTAEVGMHLHAWDSPPLEPLTADDLHHHPYLIEYPEPIMRRKIAHLTGLLEDTFGVKMTSHRAGRWAFDATYAELLMEHGYTVDCSVTPHVSWRGHAGAPGGAGGSDYRDFPEEPYLIARQRPGGAGTAALLEVPVTIRERGDALSRWLEGRTAERNPVRRVVNRLRPFRAWLRPNGWNRRSMLWLVERVAEERAPCAEFMLHSSEFMPGGSPTFPDERSIESLYRDLECLFAAVRGRFVGATLKEFHRWLGERAGPLRQGPTPARAIPAPA